MIKKLSIVSGICFGIMTGIFLAGEFNLYIVIGCAVITAIILSLFFNWLLNPERIMRQAAITDLKGNSVLHEGPANHFKNGEAVGGKLYLLKNEILFKSHKFNIQNHSQTISLQQIKEITFHNTLGLVDNGMAITTADGKVEKYVVNNRQQWKEKIEKQATSLNL
jgi:hypothetical protein